MKLLIVVSKLLTGFDAPSCTYVYLDNELHDHNLFQAICRTNRLDGDDKDYGYIVDFKELFKDVQQAIAVYNSDELDIDEGNGGSNNIELKDSLKEGRKQLDAAREALRYLCEPVPLPREVEQFLLYFCGDVSNPQTLVDTEPMRVSFYKSVAAFVAPMRTSPRALRRPAIPTRKRRRSQRTLNCTETFARPSNGTRERSWISSPSRPICGTFSTPTFRPILRKIWATSSHCL
jgi:hypothetical protein